MDNQRARARHYFLPTGSSSGQRLLWPLTGMTRFFTYRPLPFRHWPPFCFTASSAETELKTMFKAYRDNESGATTLEYAVIAALVSIGGLKSIHCITLDCLLPLFENAAKHLAG